jgi:hypothetical protein
MKRKLLVSALIGLVFAVTGPVWAGSFGPGNSGDNGTQKCHPPGQTKGAPGCK